MNPPSLGARVALLALAACALPACVTTTRTTVPDVSPVVASESREATASEARGAQPRAEPRGATGDSGLAQIGNVAATVPENIVWIPWKMIGSMMKGGSDGVQAGFEKASSYPIVSIAVSPVNLVAGLATGLVEGIGISPLLIGPNDNFGRAMKSPTTRTTTIWWYD